MEANQLPGFLVELALPYLSLITYIRSRQYPPGLVLGIEDNIMNG